MPPNGNTRSGEYADLQAVATAAAESAVNKALIARAAEDGRHSAILESVAESLRYLREDMKPLLERQTRHEAELKSHRYQIQNLQDYKEAESARVQAKVTATVRNVIHEEFAANHKDTKKAYRGIIPAIITSVATAAALWVCITVGKNFIPEKPSTPPVTAPAP